MKTIDTKGENMATKKAEKNGEQNNEYCIKQQMLQNKRIRIQRIEGDDLNGC